MRKQYFIFYIFFLFGYQTIVSQNNQESWRTISGEKYDWQKSMLPENVYMHEYHQMQLMKIFMAQPDGKGGSIVSYTFEQVLALVKGMDALTRGLPKTLYLVGWQYNGHDDKYPAWFEVNNALKRDCDADGRESLLWLAEEAKKYNTFISVHVNMTDAYDTSPLWDEYLEKGFISRNADGTPMQIGVWNDQKAYQVCYKNEWESGYAVKRIDALLELLPFIKDAGSIMLDAFFCRENQYEKISREEEESYQRKMIRYFRSKEIDVTHESFNRLREGMDLFIGISPWYLWFEATADDYMKYPAYLTTGGGSYLFVKQFPELADELLQLGFLFGMSGRGEDCFGDLDNEWLPPKNWADKYRYQFYTGTLPYVYLNRYKREKLTGKGKERIAYYSDGLVSSLKDSTITHNERLLRDKNDIFMPVLWRQGREYIAYSLTGYNHKTWQLPPDWFDVKRVDIYKITASGIIYKNSVYCDDGHLILSLEPDEAVSVFPATGKRKIN